MTVVWTGKRQDDKDETGLREPERFGDVFDRYFADIHGYVARRLGRDAADDIASETFLIAFRQRDRFDTGQGTVRAWLFGIVTRQLSRYRRQEMRAYRAAARAAAPALEDSHADRVVERVTAGAMRPELSAALAELSSGDREVLLLVALGGLSHAEIATALDIPYGTVGSRLNRVRKKLRGLVASAQETSQEEKD